MLKILIVDDSLIIRNKISRAIEELGYEVVAQAKNGKEAIDLYEKHLPDIVTMDITMPIMDGIQALKVIKRQDSNAKVVMVTSHGEERLVMDAIKTGAKGYILKPVTFRKVKDVFDKLISEYN